MYAHSVSTRIISVLHHAIRVGRIRYIRHSGSIIPHLKTCAEGENVHAGPSFSFPMSRSQEVIEPSHQKKRSPARWRPPGTGQGWLSHSQSYTIRFGRCCRWVLLLYIHDPVFHPAKATVGLGVSIHHSNDFGTSTPPRLAG